MIEPASIVAEPADEFGSEGGAKSVPFTIREDSVTVTQPGFVPFKLRPEVRSRRLRADILETP